MANKTSLSKGVLAATWIAQLVAALILAQTLYFKFTGAPESKFIFQTLGMEPAGRIGSGIVELVAVILLIVPSLAWLGALIGLASMTGAIFFHLTLLGVEVMNDGGELFYLAIVVWVACLAVLAIRRADIPVIGPMLARK